MVPEESCVKHSILLVGILGMLGLLGAACSVDVGADNGPTGCEDVGCFDALNNGLMGQGDMLCDAQSDADYTALTDCACGSGSPCDPDCGDNLCTDSGLTPACGDCLAANCGGEQDDCAGD
jgi:hypothetical protein